MSLRLLHSSARPLGGGAAKEKPLSDWYSKLLLTVIAVSAAVLAAQELRGGSRAVDEGRFRLQVLPMGRMMLRIDSQTGRTWQAAFPEPRSWREIKDTPIDTLDDAPEEGAEPEAPGASPEAAAPATPAMPATPGGEAP